MLKMSLHIRTVYAIIIMEKLNNPNFVNIPFRKILDILRYKLEENGIECKGQEESYTSQSSYLDNDNIPTYQKWNLQATIFSGKRISRNLYQSKQGKIINADLMEH